MQNRSRDEQRTVGGLLGSSLKGLLIAVSFSLGLLLILTAVSLKFEDPLRPIQIFAVAALILGAAAGGITAGSSGKDPAAGALCGAEYVLLMWLGSLFLRRMAVTPASPLLTAVGYVVCAIAAFVGGLIPIGCFSGNVRKNDLTAARRKAAQKRH